MEAEYYESEQGRHYDNNWNEKPFHIIPEPAYHRKLRTLCLSESCQDLPARYKAHIGH